MKAKAPDLKSIGMIAAAAAAAYVVYKLSNVAAGVGGAVVGAGSGFATVFSSAKHDARARGNVHFVASPRNAIEQQLLNGQITVAQAEHALYPERFAPTATDKHPALTHVGASSLWGGGNINDPNGNPYLK